MERLEKEYVQEPGFLYLLAGDELTNVSAPGSPPSVENQRRLRIWEIPDRFKCPVIGWCFDGAAQKEVLRKEGISIRDKSNFEIHEIVVESLGRESRLSRRIDSWLNRKYQREIKELSSLKKEEFIRQWNESLEKGGVEGILWVAVTKTDLPTEVERRIFGDMHMEMHVRAKQIGDERQRLEQEREKNEILVKSIREVSRANRVLKKENEELKNKLAMASRLSDTLRAQNQELENELSKVNSNDFVANLQGKNAELRAEREEILKQISAYETELRKLQNQNNKLLFKLKNQSQTRIHRDNESEGPINQNAGSSLHDPVLPLDLSQKRILLVGGFPQMESHYRRLIEGNKGVFEYHDGRMSAGAKELVRQVRRADLVLCCIDHSSHTSALVVRKVCKKHKKPFQMLLNSSLNNILSTLVTIRNNLASIQNGPDDFQSNLPKSRPRELSIQ